MARLNYDEIAQLYDDPLRDHAVDGHLLTFLADRPERWGSARFLDVGCGTGKQVAANYRQWPEARLVGVDRYRGMLRIAQKRRSAATWIQADGAILPFGANTFQYATSQFSYQHIGRTSDLLRELFRVLTPGGRFVMTNIDPWSMPGWLVYQYFPEACELDRRDFLPTEHFVALMRDVGFHAVRLELVDASVDQDLRDFLRYASERHRASQLMAIPDEAYLAGLRRVEEAIAARSENAPVRSQFVVVTICGDKLMTGRET